MDDVQMPVLTRNASKHCAVVNEGTKMSNTNYQDKLNDKNKLNATNELVVINSTEENDLTEKTEKMNKNHGSTSYPSATPGFPTNPINANTLVDTLVRQNS